MTSFASFFLLRSHYSITTILGDSMAPTFHNGETVVVKHAAKPALGQVVLFQPPETWATVPEEKELYIKRIGALPGDAYSFDGRRLTLEGRSYTLPIPCTAKPRKGVVPPGTFLVLGDNSQNSRDSRYVLCTQPQADPFVPLDRIAFTGTVVFSL